MENELKSGSKIGRLTLMSEVPRPIEKKTPGKYWVCRCNCGKNVVRPNQTLTKGTARSCGCLRSENGRRSRKKAGFSGLTRLFNNYRDAAYKRKLAFTLNRDDFQKLTSSCCSYCGISPTSIIYAINTSTEAGKFHSAYRYNGIDREDNAEGYTSKNCLTACERCNRAKYTFSKASFLEWVERIHAYRTRT